jgi:CarD family transcriptional regulator
VKLFSIGDKIVYGSEGVFTVSEYTDSPIDKNDDRRFYVLKPIFGPEGNIIMTPVDNINVKMRAVMDRSDALSFIERIPDICILTVEKEKNRRDTYREALACANCEQYVSIIKTVYARREEAIKQKKRLAESDNDYEKKAKFCLFGELSVAMGISVSEVERLVEDKICGVAV